MFASFVSLLVKTPIYPHWLEHLKMRQGNQVILKGVKGKVLEVGAGDGSRKVFIMNHFPAIKKYVATDFSSWDDEFKRNDGAAKYGKAGEIFMGRSKRAKLDKVCSATKLPFRTNTFDSHLSFEVLEHIDDPKAYFSEAARVVKQKGKLIFSVPFLYREHSMDRQRYTSDYFRLAAKDNGLKVMRIYTNTGFGTTVAVMTNQWIVRRILEGPIVVRPLLLLLSPPLFLINNVTGWIIDLKPDSRFTTRYHVVMKKL
jgi:ubiquinone/menaquinone biosynthesis C-methylase UbiE